MLHKTRNLVEDWRKGDAEKLAAFEMEADTAWPGGGGWQTTADEQEREIRESNLLGAFVTENERRDRQHLHDPGEAGTEGSCLHSVPQLPSGVPREETREVRPPGGVGPRLRGGIPAGRSVHVVGEPEGGSPVQEDGFHVAAGLCRAHGELHPRRPPASARRGFFRQPRLVRDPGAGTQAGRGRDDAGKGEGLRVSLAGPGRRFPQTGVRPPELGDHRDREQRPVGVLQPSGRKAGCRRPPPGPLADREQEAGSGSPFSHRLGRSRCRSRDARGTGGNRRRRTRRGRS